jgi:CCR4-NOT transcription complex subunit 1
LSEQQGIDTYLHFIRRLIVQCQGRLIQGPSHPHVPHSGTSAHDPGAALTFRLLVHETQRLARDPFLADRLRDALDRGEGEVFRTFDVNRFVDRLGLRPTERLVLASALVKAGRKELAMQALAMVRADFEPAVLGLCQTPTFDGVDLPLAGVAKLMGNLLTDLPSEMPIIDAAQRQALILAVQSKYGSDAVVPVLTRILPALTLVPGASLVPTLAQMGPELTGHIEIVLSLFLRFGISDVTPPPESLVLDIVSALGRLAMEGTLMCDANVIIQALASLNPNISWPDLIRTLDLPEKRGVDTATLKLIIAILAACPRDAEPHAVHGLWGEWNNQLYQLKLLDTLLLLPPDTFSFINLPGRRIVTVDDVAVASPTIKSLAANVQGHSWNSLDLYDVLCLAAANPSVEVRSYVKDMLDKVIKLCPELVHLGLLQANAPSSALRSDYAQKLLGMFFARHQNHQLVFMRIWQLQPSYLFSAFREFYDDKNSNIARVLDIAQDLKILDSLLEMHPWTFALDLASLASRREYLNLEKWLQDSVDKHGLEFLDSVIQFLRTKMEAESERMHDPPTESSTISLTPAHVAIFLRLLKTHMDELTPEEQEYSLTTRTVCLQVYPRLMSFAPNSGDAGLNVITYPQDIENEVESIYRQMFDGTISLDAVLGLLQHRHGSMHQREIDLFACSLHFLFDEYRFFNTYPPAELEMTGRLFGSIIQLGFIDGVPLGIALRYVCEALARAENSPLFNFGYAAITQFENRLPEWPPVCQRLIRIPHLQEHWPDFVNTLRRAIAASDVVASAAARASEPFASIQPDPITEDIEHPPEDLSDKILFVINNLAPSNFDAKLSDMQQHFEDRYSRWLARYLVDQRVSTEPNNHALYLRFLDALDRRPLFRYILQETLVKSANLLNADSTLASSSERAVLKNIAVWLGTITLARDRPIRHNNLSFKDLLLEAADNSRLILAIPFVCKTLEPCAKSNVFKPPNPWLMAVLGVLAELYHFAELKLNLKFEIEVLCKSLDIMLDSIEPSMLFRERPTTNAATLMEEYADLPPLPSTSSVVPNYDISGGALIGAVDGGNGVLSRLGQGLGAPTSPGESQRAVDDHIESILAALGQSVRVPRDFYEASSHNPSLKRAVQVAVDRAVREIIVPVVERSVTIAGISTRELAAKDFATEPSEEKLKKAAQMMSQKLAGSLALVTCKDPLKANLSTHMRQALMEHGYNDVGDHMWRPSDDDANDVDVQNIPQQAVDMFVTENLEIACSAIEKAAMERAVMDVDETLAMSFENRRGHREVGDVLTCCLGI